MIKHFTQPRSCFEIPCGAITVGGPDLKIAVAGGKIAVFEMHGYCGPMPLRNNGTERLKPLPGFWDAIQRWILGGKLVDGDTCIVPVWCTDCGATGNHIALQVGNFALVDRVCDGCNGTKVRFVNAAKEG